MNKINQITRADVDLFRVEAGAQQSAYNTMNLYQRIATQSAIYPGQGTPLGLVYVALKGAGEAGEFAEHVGKAMRDDGLMIAEDDIGDGGIVMLNGSLTVERHALLVKEIGDQLWYLSAKCNELGISLSEAALVNLEKLLDRTERNALQGSGDAR